jgi:hypothetical protein
MLNNIAVNEFFSLSDEELSTLTGSELKCLVHISRHNKELISLAQFAVGTGLSKKTIISSLISLDWQELIDIEEDDSDKGRIKKYYRLLQRC